MPVRIFVSYSHKDAEFRRKLEIHLAALKREGVGTFYDGDIHPGADLDATIKSELRAANVFVALASPEYLHSEYCFEKEYGYALRRARRKMMHVIVAVIRPCQWQHTRMARYKALPEDGKEVVRWGSRDSAFEDIVNGVRRVVKLAQVAQSALPAKRPRKPAAAKARRNKATAASTKATVTKAAARETPPKQRAKVPRAGALAKTIAEAGTARSARTGTKRKPKSKKK